MTSINRLTTKPNLDDLDYIPIWDSTAGRTRNIQSESIKAFISDLIPDNDPVVGGSITEGQLTLHTKSGQDIEIGSVSGVKVEDDYITQFYVDGGIQVLIEDGAATLSQNITKSVWPIQTITIGESPLSIDSPEQYGIDYEFSYNGSTVMNPSVLLFNAQEGAQIKISTRGMAKESKPVTVSQLTSGEQKEFWYVTTPTVFMFHEDKWRVEESSQLTHLDSAGVPDGDAVTFNTELSKTPVIGITAKPGSAITTEVTDGVLLIGGGIGQDVDLDEYQRLDAESIDYPAVEITPTETGRSLRVKNLDGTDILSAFVGNDQYGVEYLKTLQDYEENSTPFDIINKMYANFHYVKQGGGFIAGDVVLMQSNCYLTGSEFMSDADFFYWKTGTIFSCGDVSRTEDGSWTGDIVDFGVMRDDYIEFEKLAVKDFYVYDSDGNTMIHSNPTAKATSFNNFVEFKQGATYKGPTENEFNLINRKALDEALSGGGTYSGEGESIPNRRLVSTGSLLQEKVSDQFTNNQNTQEEFQINLDESLSGAVTYINGGNIPSRRFTVRDNKTSRTSSRTIRAGESWVCHSYLPGDFNTTNFEWFRLDIGASAQFVASDWLGAQRYAIISDNVTCFKPNNHFEIKTDGGSALRISFNDDLEYGELKLKCTKGANDYKFVTVIAMNGKQSDFKLYPDYDYHIKVSAKENVDIEFIKTLNDLKSVTFDDIDVSGFDADVQVKPLIKRFSNTDLITIPLTLPDGFSVMVRQVLVKRSSGVELEMDFTYKYNGTELQVHLNEAGTGFLLAGIIKDEI